MRPRLLLVLLLALAACSGGPRHPSGRLPLAPCPAEAPGGARQGTPLCGTLAVPARRDAHDGRAVDLRVMVLPATGPSAEDDAIALVPGGPGRSARADYELVARVLEPLQRSREMLLVDPRGTDAPGLLGCTSGGAAPQLLEPPELDAFVTACAEEASVPVGTTIGAQDLEAVREALGYRRLTLLGLDYGTRVALAYARRYAEHVRAMVLVGVQPLEVAIGSDTDYNAHVALRSLLGRCERDPDCAGHFPRLRAEVEALTVAAQRDGASGFGQWLFPGQQAGARRPPRTEVLAGAVATLLTDAGASARLPALLHATATSGSDELLHAAIELSQRELRRTRIWVRYATLCSEDYPRFAARPDETRFLGGSLRTRLEAVCSRWPRQDPDPTAGEPVEASAPVLLVSVVGDPLSPGRYTDVAQNHLKRVVEVVLKGNGRPDLSRGCLPELVASFVGSGGRAPVDTSCTRSIEPLPFVLGLSPTP